MKSKIHKLNFYKLEINFLPVLNETLCGNCPGAASCPLTIFDSRLRVAETINMYLQTSFQSINNSKLTSSENGHCQNQNQQANFQHFNFMK